MTEIKRSRNIIEIMNGIEEKVSDFKRNKSRTKSQEFLFFPLMNIKNKFKISNKFDEKHSEKLLQEKDKYLEVVELDDRIPEEIEERPFNKISKNDPLKFTFGM